VNRRLRPVRAEGKVVAERGSGPRSAGW